MAEFCLDCWGKISGEEATESQYVLSEELELCEGCGELKRVSSGGRMIKESLYDFYADSMYVLYDEQTDTVYTCESHT